MDADNIAVLTLVAVCWEKLRVGRDPGSVFILP